MNKYISMLFLSACTMQMNAQEYLATQDGQYIPVSKINSIKGEIKKEHSRSLSVLLKNDKEITIMTAALEATGWMEELKCYEDAGYTWANEQDIQDSCTWTNDALCIHTAQEYDNVAYPETRRYSHTVFAVKDEALKEKFGINSLDDLKKKAKEIYDAVYPEDVNVTDVKDKRNSLNRFVAYNILPFDGDYYSLTAMDNGYLAHNFNRKRLDISDYYETCMPHSLMKFSYPSGLPNGLYINRRGVQSREDYYGVYERGAKVSKPDWYAPEQQNALNGSYHYIDSIAAYDKNTQKVVLNERIRVDCSTLSPDFMTIQNDGDRARGHKTKISYGYYSKYGTSVYQEQIAANNRNHCFGFKSGWVRNFEYDENTHLHVRNRVREYYSYQGDEVIIKGQFDVKVKIPSLPEGTYEVRLGTCVGFESRAVVQFYIDDVAAGIPFDMRQSSRDLFGWKSDYELGSEENIAAFDKAIRNQGWMKGPDSYASGNNFSFPSLAYTFRGNPDTIRRIIGTLTTDGKSDHYLRMKQLNENGGEIDFDYLEFVPKSICNNEELPEDRY